MSCNDISYRGQKSAPTCKYPLRCLKCSLTVWLLENSANGALTDGNRKTQEGKMYTDIMGKIDGVMNELHDLRGHL